MFFGQYILRYVTAKPLFRIKNKNNYLSKINYALLDPLATSYRATLENYSMFEILGF